MNVEHELLAIERPLWTNDAAIYESSLIEDAVLVFAETGVLRREPALAAIRQENAEGRRWAEVQFDEAGRQMEGSLSSADAGLAPP